MAKTTAGPAATQDTAAAAPRFWKWTGAYGMYVADLGLDVRPGDVVEGDEPPTWNPTLWVEDAGPATVTAGQPAGHRTWTPEELQRGALAEDPPTTPGWADPAPEPAADPPVEPAIDPAVDPAPVTTDDQPTEVDQ